MMALRQYNTSKEQTQDLALLTMLGVVIITLDVVSLNTRLGVYYQIQLHFYSVLGVVIHVS